MRLHYTRTQSVPRCKHTPTRLFKSILLLLYKGRVTVCSGDRGSTVVKVLFPSQLVSLEFFIDIQSFQSHNGPGVDSSSNRNEYQEYFLGGKGGRCVRLTTLPPSCAAVMRSGNLNFLEPSGPLQVCNRTDLPFSLFVLRSI